MRTDALSGTPNILPFVKWAGGKRWLVQKFGNLFPTEFDRYIEPFLGSGAVFFKLQPKSAILSDRNAELINAYLAIRERPDLVRRYLSEHQRKHSNRHYYETRQSQPCSTFSRAARTIYLNRTCWNALYRVNLSGEFNVPKGTKSQVLQSTDDFFAVSKLLANATILTSDFEKIIDNTKCGDFVFIDPPYTVKHNVNGFIKYNEHIFSWDDQVRLHDAVVRAASRGAKILATNANHTSVQDLYKEFRTFPLERASVIAGKSSARGRFRELIIQSW